MRTLATMVTWLCTLSLLASPALAQDRKDDAKAERSPVHKRQMERINECNVKAADRKGGERKRFMTACLKANAGQGKDDGKMSQQQSRVSSCSKEAADRGLQGDARMKFMGACTRN